MGKAGTCRYDQAKVFVKVSGAITVKKELVSCLEDAITVQPVIVGVDASSPAFMSYSGGILSGDSCGTNVNHALLAVGYGSSADGDDYYILQNSWGATWGEQGYMKIAAVDGPGVCGIQEIEMAILPGW